MMFIHSDDAYKPKEERTNVKKIVVAKHRNGATGDIELYFDGNKTTFMTIEKNSFDDYGSNSQGITHTQQPVPPEDDF